MPHYSDILGMNARNQLYTSQNPASAKSIANSKYATKILLDSKDIPHPKILGLLATSEDVQEYDWDSLTTNFVLKPTNGYAGKGVVVFRKKDVQKNVWIDTLGNNWTLADIQLHCSDILEGLYSSFGTQHNVIIEERVILHPSLRKYAYKGTADIRVIVYNSVPVMSMLRLPTIESEGRANMSQGAIAAGIDMASGITTYASTGKGQPITHLPGTKRKLNGIKIPYWKKTLVTAVQAAQAARLEFCGIDLFIDPDKGPLVVELNANPGLSIQAANRAGLRRRLERVEGLNVLDADHGVRIGQALFAESFADKIKAKDGLAIVNHYEKISVFDDAKKEHEAFALMNTGRFRSAIAKNLAEELGLLDIDDLLWYQEDSPKEQPLPVIEVNLMIKDRRVKATCLVSSKLNRRKQKIEIGRNDLQGFLVGDNT